MRIVPITVAIPVGPLPHHRRWLQAALESIAAQTVKPDEILLVEDGPAHQDAAHIPPGYRIAPQVRVESIPWRSGVAHAFNVGVIGSANKLVLMMGSDDELLPGCIAACWAAWERERDPYGYYYLGVKYHDGQQQNTPCNAAMVHKDLWHSTGGYPPEAGVGACDTWLISLLMSRPDIGALIAVDPQSVHYRYRDHPDTATATSRPYWGLITQARDYWVQSWEKPC